MSVYSALCFWLRGEKCEVTHLGVGGFASVHCPYLTQRPPNRPPPPRPRHAGWTQRGSFCIFLGAQCKDDSHVAFCAIFWRRVLSSPTPVLLPSLSFSSASPPVTQGLMMHPCAIGTPLCKLLALDSCAMEGCWCVNSSAENAEKKTKSFGGRGGLA